MSLLKSDQLKMFPPDVVQLILWGVACEEFGVREMPGSGNNTRILEYHKATSLMASDDATPWCSAFVNWVCKEVGVEGTNKANARSWLEWGWKVDDPKVGDIVILDRGPEKWTGHVGFLAKKPGLTTITLLGGNQSDEVNFSTYMKARVLGYRRFKGQF